MELITITKRTRRERIVDSYAMLRVCIARLIRGDKPRFRLFLFR